MNSNIKNRIPLAIASAILLATTWGTSSAFADEQLRSEKVKFSDLNVNSPEGAQALYGRIHAAAKRVCSESDPVMHAAETACIGKAEAGAIGQLNLSQLTAYYKNKTGKGDRTERLASR